MMSRRNNLVVLLILGTVCWGGACARRPLVSSPLAAPAAPVVLAAPAAVSPPRPATSATVRKVLDSAIAQTRTTRIYDPAYVSIPYPNGDVPRERGVCADVIVRAFRAGRVDLQKTVHKDMRAHFAAYPKLWGLRRPDTNIDHRRVANLMTYFKRQCQSRPVTTNAEDYHPADVVAWGLPGGRLHIGVVSETLLSGTNRHEMIHNIGEGTRQEDVLFAWRIIGHYRGFK